MEVKQVALTSPARRRGIERLALGVLVVLCVLACVACGPDTDASSRSLVKGLGGVLKSPHLKASEVTVVASADTPSLPGDPTCLQAPRLVIKAGQTCSYKLKDSVWLNRKLVAANGPPQSSGSVFTIRQGKGSTETFNPGRNLDVVIERQQHLIVFKKTTVLSVHCNGPQPCTLTLN